MGNCISGSDRKPRQRPANPPIIEKSSQNLVAQGLAAGLSPVEVLSSLVLSDKSTNVSSIEQVATLHEDKQEITMIKFIIMRSIHAMKWWVSGQVTGTLVTQDFTVFGFRTLTDNQTYRVQDFAQELVPPMMKLIQPIVSKLFAELHNEDAYAEMLVVLAPVFVFVSFTEYMQAKRSVRVKGAEDTLDLFVVLALVIFNPGKH